MRSIIVVAIVIASLFAVCESEATNERATLMSEAVECCSRTCDAHDDARLKARLEQYTLQNGRDESLVHFMEKVFTRQICHAVSKKTDYIGVTCPTTVYDVAAADVQVNCTYSAYMSAGVYYAGIYGYIYTATGLYSSISAINGYFYDNLASSQFWSGTATFTLKRYAAHGNYTVSAYSYAVNYTTSVSASTTIRVAKTSNDMAAPVLTNLVIPPINIFDQTGYALFTATDDLSGINSLQINIQNASSGQTVGYGSYYLQNGETPQTTLTNSVSFYLYSPITPGTYTIYAYLYDALGQSSYYYAAQLNTSGLQTTVIVGQSYCPAGKYLPYGATGACLTCPTGTTSNAFAFACKACPAGTYPNGTSSCGLCPLGTYGVGGSSYCTYCSAGFYSYSLGQRRCYPCSPGTYSAPGATQCSSCTSGTYSNAAAGSCTPCPAGKASYGYAAVCQSCEPGYYAPLGSTAYSCLACPAGTYSAGVASSSCTSCPAGTRGPAASNSVLNCM